MESLFCPLCRGYCRNAFTCCYCGNSYCQVCLENYLRDNSCRCPHCKIKITQPGDFVPNRQLRQLIIEFKRLLNVTVDTNESSASYSDVITIPHSPQHGQVSFRWFNSSKATWKEFYLCSMVGLVPLFGPLVNLGYTLYEGDLVHTGFYLGFALLDASVLTSSSAYSSFYLLGQDMINNISVDVLVKTVREKLVKDASLQSLMLPGMIDRVAAETTSLVTNEIGTIFSTCFFNKCVEGLVWCMKTKVIQSLFIWNYFRKKIYFQD